MDFIVGNPPKSHFKRWLLEYMRRKKKVLIGGAIALLACVLIAVRLTDPFSWIDTDATPERAFATLAQREMPSSVSNIQANGAFWMDYQFCLRFSAPPAVVDDILQLGYETCRWDEVSSVFTNAMYSDGFTPAWHPEITKAKECFRRRIDSENAIDNHYVVLDRKAHIVYAVAEGNNIGPH